MILIGQSFIARGLYMQIIKGFTLIELMVTLVVLGIVATMAMPNLMPVVYRMQLDTTARELADHLSKTRGTAISIRKEVSLNFASTPNPKPDDQFFWLPENPRISLVSQGAPAGVTFTPVGLAKPRSTTVLREVPNPGYRSDLPEDPNTNPRTIPQWLPSTDLVFELCHEELNEIRLIRIFKGGVIESIQTQPLVGSC